MTRSISGAFLGGDLSQGRKTPTTPSSSKPLRSKSGLDWRGLSQYKSNKRSLAQNYSNDRKD